MSGVDPLVDQPPHRGRRRRGTKDVFAIPPALPDTVDAIRAVGHRGGQIGEHRTRPVDPRAPIGIRQRRRDLRRQPGQLRQLPQDPRIPACDTTPSPSADTFTRETAALFFTCEVPSSQENRTLEKSYYSLRDRHFSVYLHAIVRRISRIIQVSGDVVNQLLRMPHDRNRADECTCQGDVREHAKTEREKVFMCH